MGTVFGRGKRRAGQGWSGENTKQGGEIWERFVLVGWGTRGCGEVREGVGVE